MCCQHPSRREFMGLAAAGTAGVSLLPASAFVPSQALKWDKQLWNPELDFINPGKPLRVQPVLMYHLPTKREAASWKSWGGVQTEEGVSEEVNRITKELKTVSAKAEFPIEVLPVAKATSIATIAGARNPAADVTLIYPASGSGKLLRACIPERGDAVVFVRHRSGPVYYWYEALSTRYLRPDRPGAASADSADAPRLSVHDVVVDDSDETLWRFRALYGKKNFVGSKIIALGGAGGKYAPDAPRIAREKYQLDIVETSYDDLGKRIQSAMNDPARMAQAEQWSVRYLSMPGTALETDRKFVVNAFVLYGIFKELMHEHGASAFTINSCMGTILPMAKTTACLTLGLLNDEGLLAFCESDFVIVPPGILLRHIAGRPVFLHNSTFPHNGVVTCAHCTAPRRMNGTRYEPARILTHYESEYGAAPKVEIPPGQEVTIIDPEYATGRWVGIKGVVESNPFYEICRSQQDVRILGNWKKLLNEARDSHWVMVYGDYLKEIAYTAPRIGVTWDAVTEA